MAASGAIPPARLRDAMTARKLGVGELAKEAGISTKAMSRALSGRPISLETRLRLSIALAKHRPDPRLERVLEELEAG